MLIVRLNVKSKKKKKKKNCQLNYEANSENYYECNSFFLLLFFFSIKCMQQHYYSIFNGNKIF